MALIKCSECNREVSTKAGVCPHCGNPIKGNRVTLETAPGRPIQTEPVLVSKKWKKRSLISLGITLLGLFFSGIGGLSMIGSISSDGDDVSFGIIFFPIGFLLFIGGFISLIVSRVGAYYNDRRMN